MMLRYLPVGLLGLVFASLLAAFMSTVSTQVNWGASYIVRDLYQRFVARRGGRAAPGAGRPPRDGAASPLLAAAASFAMSDVGRIFRFIILIGNGSGTVLLLRWFWWRVNAWAEWAALLVAPLIALLATFVPGLDRLSFGAKLALTAFGAVAVWVPVMLLTAPERARGARGVLRPRAAGRARMAGRARPHRPGAVVGPGPRFRGSGRDAGDGAGRRCWPSGGIVVGSAGWALGASAALLAGWMLRGWVKKRGGDEVMTR